LIKLHKPDGPIRRIGAPIARGMFVFALFLGAAFSTLAQTSNPLPHAWNEAVYAMAQKAAAALGSGRAFSAEVKDVSAAAPVELADIRRAFDDDMTLRGMRPVAASADAQVEISISETLAGFELVAEIHQADAQQVAVVAVAGEDAVTPQPGPEPGLQRKIVWQQAEQLLDFDQVSADANHAFWYFLEPERLDVYEFIGQEPGVHFAQPISRHYGARDLRGWIQVADATHVNVFVGGVRCDGTWNPTLTLECGENSGQQWPMGPVSWTFTPGRNYFSGTVTVSSSLQLKLPPFYSSASPLAATSGQAASRRVIAGVDGQAQFFEGGADAVSRFAAWGSDVTSLASGCGSGWQVLATGAGDWTQKDEIQLYEIRDTKAIAIGQPLELPGPTLAIWGSDDGKFARVISRNLETGLYEASMVTIRCGN
jgi:hypothetical protein